MGNNRSFYKSDIRVEGTETAVILAYSLSLSLNRSHTAYGYFQTDADPTQTTASPDTASKAILRSAMDGKRNS